MEVSVRRSQLYVSPWQGSCKPHGGSRHFPAFVSTSRPSKTSRGSRYYSADGTPLSADICATKGFWTCHDNSRQRTLRLGVPQGSIFAPLRNLQPQTIRSSLKGRLRLQNSLSSNNDTLLESEQTFEEGLTLTFKIFLSVLTHLPSGVAQFVLRHADPDSPNHDYSV